MSQGSYQVPTGGSESAVTFAIQCNGAWLALASKNSGNLAPANGPNNLPTQFQDWADTTNPLLVVYKTFDGVNYPRVGTLDTVNSIFCPKQGGGLGTIASASTTNIFSQPQTFITITGAVGIFSFGSAGEPGEWKWCQAATGFTIHQGSSIHCPFGVNLIVAAGDIFKTINDGTGLTIVTDYQPATPASIASVNALVNSRTSVTTDGTFVTNANKGTTIALSGNAGTDGQIRILNFGPASGYDANFQVVVVNEDGRGWYLSIDGYSAFILWPGQSKTVYAQNNVWHWTPEFERYVALGGPLTVYVDPVNGFDGNDGLEPIFGAFLTIQGALNTVRDNIDLHGTPPTFQLADGLYSVGSGVDINYSFVGAAQVYITGNVSSPANVVVQCVAGGSCFAARDGGATASLSGMTLAAAGSGSTTLLNVSQLSVIDLGVFGPVNFGAAAGGYHVYVTTNASVNFLNSYTITDSASYHIFATNAGVITYGGSGGITAIGASFLVFATAFASVSNCGVITALGVPMNFSGFGAVSGKKFLCSANGVIDAAGAIYPGNIAGTTQTGGQHV